jgi:hypothetical protein
MDSGRAAHSSADAAGLVDGEMLLMRPSWDRAKLRPVAGRLDSLG